MARRERRRTALWCNAGAVVTAALVVGGSAAASTPRCFWKVSGPQTRPGILVSKADFHCDVAYPGTHTRVAIQRRVKGRWETVGQTRQTIDVAAGQNYTVTTSVPCRATLGFTGVMIRTFFAFRFNSSRFVLPSAPENALCRFTKKP